MRIDAVTIGWIVFALVAIRMIVRMADGGATPLHFVLMGLAGAGVAALIAHAGMLYRRRKG